MPERAKGRCPGCLQPRLGNEDPAFGLSFAPPCEHCDYRFIPEPEPRLFAWVCPHCVKQYTGPHGHRMAGDDCASSCSHAHPGERGVTQPKLVKIEVQPLEPFEPKPIPHDKHARVVPTSTPTRQEKENDFRKGSAPLRRDGGAER